MTLLSCSKCPKVFSKPSHLHRHAQSHSHDRAFACELCGKRFTREDSKARHVRRLHKTDNEYLFSTSSSPRNTVNAIARSPTTENSNTREEPAEEAAAHLRAWAVQTIPFPANSTSVPTHLDRSYAIADEDVARLLVPFQTAIPRQETDVALEDGLTETRQNMSQPTVVAVGAFYDVPMPSISVRDSAEELLGPAETGSSAFGISSYIEDVNRAPGDSVEQQNQLVDSGEQQNQLWQDIPTWEAALESDTFFDSWLQYDPQNSLANTASSFAPIFDTSRSDRDFYALSQSFSQPQGSSNSILQQPQDKSAPPSQPSLQTTTFWSQWLQAESTHSSPNLSGVQGGRVVDGPSDVYSGLKSLVGSPAAVNSVESGRTTATLSVSHLAAPEGTNVSLQIGSSEAEEMLPEDQWQTIAGENAPITFSPEDESSTLPTLGTIDGQAWEAIRDRLQASLNLSDTLEVNSDMTSMIPGITIGFIKSCLHLYFTRFHRHFPVIHEPTFSPRYSPAYLCLMMVAIGSTFIGTVPTSKLGQWIARRVHHLMVNNREQRLASINSRVEFALAGVLGQTFSLLHGAPAELLTAEAFHSGVCGLVRRSGIMVSTDRVAPPIHLGDLPMSGQMLSQAWQRWALLESLNRTSIGLAIHAAELYQFSSVPGLLPRRVAGSSPQIESLFAAPTASAWKSILRSMGGAEGNSIAMPISSTLPDSFHVHALLGQVLMDIHNSREMEQGCVLLRSQYESSAQFYKIMMGLAHECGISCRKQVAHTADSRHQIFQALWHYCYVDYWSSSRDIEAAVGRYGTNIVARQALERLRAWVNTPAARLAALHAISVLEAASSLNDVNFLIPRAIYRSALLLFCILSLSDAQYCDPSRSIEIADAVHWLHLAELCGRSNAPCITPAVAPAVGTPSDPLSLYILSGGVIVSRPFLAGQDRHTDIVSLLAGSMRLLTTSTQWGLGGVLAGLLAQISINAQA